MIFACVTSMQEDYLVLATRHSSIWEISLGCLFRILSHSFGDKILKGNMGLKPLMNSGYQSSTWEPSVTRVIH